MAKLFHSPIFPGGAWLTSETENSLQMLKQTHIHTHKAITILFKNSLAVKIQQYASTINNLKNRFPHSLVWHLIDAKFVTDKTKFPIYGFYPNFTAKK